MNTIPDFKAHSSVLIPLEAWCFHGPLLRKQGKAVDLGLLAEAMIYYDNIFLQIQRPADLDALIGWFVQAGKYKDLLGFFRDGVFHVYHCAFISTAILKEDSYSLWNMQGEDQKEANSFIPRILQQAPLEKHLHHARHRAALMGAISERLIETKAEEFSPAIENTRIDSQSVQRSTLWMQSLVDEIYPLLPEKKPIDVKTTIQTRDDGMKQITWNLNFDLITSILGTDVNFHRGTPLVAAAIANRAIQSASQLRCDMYLASPLSSIVGDKLYEVQSRSVKAHAVIDQLVEEVEFPEVRRLVNEGKLGLDEVLLLRKKAKRFREWLQNESSRNRSALIAYHQEVAKESGITRAGRSTLKLFGVVGGSVAGAAIGTIAGDPTTSTLGAIGGAAAGNIASESLKYLSDVAGNMRAGWRPVVFGNWMSSRIEHLLSSTKETI